MVSLLVTSSSSSALLYPSSIIVAATALLPPREISLSSVSPFVVAAVVLSGSGPSSHDDRCYVVEVVDHPRRNLSAASAVIAPSPERKEPVNQNASLIPSPLHSLSASLCLVHAYAACLVAKMTPPPRRKRYNLIIICLAGKARKQATHAERRAAEEEEAPFRLRS